MHVEVRTVVKMMHCNSVHSFERVEQQGGSESITLSKNADGCGAAPDSVRHGWARATASE